MERIHIHLTIGTLPDFEVEVTKIWLLALGYLIIYGELYNEVSQHYTFDISPIPLLKEC